jgi:hypothetical protein
MIADPTIAELLFAFGQIVEAEGFELTDAGLAYLDAHALPDGGVGPEAA